jgi:phosphoribosyl 1,2-cyclic phosphate phosphodiesterase
MEIRFLGTGAAAGIPAINCDCAHCRRARREGGKLVRQRSAILFSLPGYNLLVDTPPDIRNLVIDHRITSLDGIFATSAGYDHIGGIKEFEYWQESLDFLAEESLFQTIRTEHWTLGLERVMFPIPYYAGSSLYFDAFSLIPFAARRAEPVFGMSLKEGAVRVIYTADTPVRLTNYARRVMLDCDVLIVNTPRFEPPDDEHITVVEAIALKEQVHAKQLILTYINHSNRPHDELEAYIARFPGVATAYDGFAVEV